MQRTSSRLAAALGSEQPLAHWSDKIVRQRAPTQFYKHPKYLYAREKILNNVWREHLIFKASLYAVVPFFLVAKVFQA
jgi:hypothetical protein